jgi:hypothetical protein
MSVSVELLRDNVEPEDIALFSAFTLTATFRLLLSTLVACAAQLQISVPRFCNKPLHVAWNRVFAPALRPTV